MHVDEQMARFTGGANFWPEAKLSARLGSYLKRGV